MGHGNNIKDDDYEIIKYTKKDCKGIIDSNIEYFNKLKILFCKVMILLIMKI